MKYIDARTPDSLKQGVMGYYNLLIMNLRIMMAMFVMWNPDLDISKIKIIV